MIISGIGLSTRMAVRGESGLVRDRGDYGIVMPRRGEVAMRHRGRPLLRDARRTRAWPVLALCVIVIATLGLLLREQAQPDALDSVVDTATVASFSGHHGVLPWLALPGSTIPLIAVSIAIAVGCLIARRPNGMVLAVTAVPVTAFLDDTVLKHLVNRTHLGQLSFPSGHTASAMTLATVLGVLLHDPAQRTATRVARCALVDVACAITALVAVGVIGLRWHYFTDTVGGVALGAGTVLALAFLIDLVTACLGRVGSAAASTASASEAP
jgi:membrane-associated phospholipid phosphatase